VLENQLTARLKVLQQTVRKLSTYSNKSARMATLSPRHLVTVLVI